MSVTSSPARPSIGPTTSQHPARIIWLRRALMLLVAGFVGAALVKLGRGFRSAEIELSWSLLGVVTLCLVGTNLVQAMAWVHLLNRMTHRRLPIAPILSGFMSGQLARYLPSGKVALLVIRTAAVGTLGLSSRLVAASIPIEVLSWLTMGMLIGTTATMALGHQAAGVGLVLSKGAVPLAVATVSGVLLLTMIDRRRFPSWLLRAVHAEGEGPILSWRVLAWQAGSWMGPVVQGLLLPLAVGAHFAQAWPNVGLFLLAPVAGFLAVVAPGGLGVREAVLSFALTAELGPSRALAVALLARASFVVSEVLSWTIAKCLVRRRTA